MNYRNAKRLANGWIDCEIEHPNLGWIPFTCDPNDTGAQFDVAAFHAQMDADPATAAYVPPTQEELDAAAAIARQNMSLSFAQLLIGLVTEGWITEADGNGWLSGVLPPSVEATINLIPADQRFAARARATRPSEVLRLDPLVQMMSMAQGRSPEEVDDFFVKYATV
jgi:hypothetical protein